MPLTLEELQEIQADAMADDLEVDFDRMSLWSKDEAVAYFESGGEDVPGAGAPAPPPHPPIPKPSEDDLKKWIPKYKETRVDGAPPAFRMVCFHNAGSAESVYSGKGLRVKEDNPFVAQCKTKKGELLAIELPGREQRRNEPRSRTYRPYCEQLFPILAPLLQEDVPYVVVSHSMGTWFSYEWMKLLCEKGIPLPKMWVVSGFPAPNIPEKDRPWNVNAPMNDSQFMDECRGWDVNEIVFQAGNWKSFSPMMRDDFALFDEYVFTPPPPHVAKMEFPIPMLATYFEKDKRCKKHHLEMWKEFTSEKLTFTAWENAGNHLFFYDVPARAEWMKKVIAKLPAAFQ